MQQSVTAGAIAWNLREIVIPLLAIITCPRRGYKGVGVNSFGSAGLGQLQ
jgi:hypothetical protein